MFFSINDMLEKYLFVVQKVVISQVVASSMVYGPPRPSRNQFIV